QRPEHPKASYEDYCDGKHHVEKLVPPSRCKITTKQQPNRCRMIVEDQNMSDCFATYGDRPRQDREDFLRSSRCCIRQPVGSNIHHSFLKRSKIDISQNGNLFRGTLSSVGRFAVPGLFLAITRAQRYATVRKASGLRIVNPTALKIR